jgi:glycerate kinase
VAATGGELRTARVAGPLGDEVEAVFGLLPAAADGRRTAALEMAEASGLHLVPADRLDPLRASTYGTGQLILAALDAGAREILLGIGGSATVDGGWGCARALGVRFAGDAGGPAGITGIDVRSLDPRLARTRLRVACDVTNPLLGPEGAAAVYGPQKGATPDMVVRLEAGLTNLARRFREDLGADVADRPGAGAAGGLGAGLAAMAGAVLEPGFPLVAEAIGLAERLAGADLCLTGEGSLDAQSARGKAATGVAELARRLGVRVVCVPGRTTDDAPRHLFDDVRPLVAGGVEEAEALSRPEALLAKRAAEASFSAGG